jgi:CheY-like chemotaxis protein
VDHLITEQGAAVGVALADGTEFRAPVVVSSLDPRRTFLQLADPRELPAELVDTIQRFRFQGVASKVNFALDGLPRYPALDGRTDQYLGFVNVAPTVEYMERAYDAAKYGWYSEHPYLDASVQSMIDPDMAPPGKHVMSCFVMYTPHQLKGATWPAERERMADRVQATLQRFFPGFDDLVLQREVVTPDIIEERTGLSEGTSTPGSSPTHQMYVFRPAPGYSDYRTPIRGYYQCGSGTHPGGCVIGAPGRLAQPAGAGGHRPLGAGPPGRRPGGNPAPGTIEFTEPSYPGPMSVSGRRLLVVEDEPLMASLLSEVLVAQGFVVQTAANTLQARTAVDSFDPDAALLDISLGDGPSGLDLAHVLDRKYPHIALLFLTKHADARTAGLADQDLPAGCGFLRKDRVRDTGYLLESLESVLAERPDRVRDDQDPANPAGPAEQPATRGAPADGPGLHQRLHRALEGREPVLRRALGDAGLPDPGHRAPAVTSIRASRRCAGS